MAQLERDARAGNAFAIRALTEKAPRIAYGFYWQCLHEVDSMRQGRGYGLGPVPLDKLYWYAEVVLGLDAHETDMFVYVIGRADRYAVNMINERANKRTKPGK